MKKIPQIWNFRSRRTEMAQTLKIEADKRRLSAIHESTSSAKAISPAQDLVQRRSTGYKASRTASVPTRPILLTSGHKCNSTRHGSVCRHLKSESLNPQTPTTSTSKMLGFFKTTKSSQKDQPGPGPGAYHFDLEIGGVSYRIGTAKRVRERKPLYVGPGAYDIPPSPTGIMSTMTPRRSYGIRKIEDFPGPGTYTPTGSSSGVKFSISRAQRHRERVVQSPGPGAYNFERPKSLRSAVTVKSQRPPLSQILDTPGPGSYHFDLSIGGPEMSLGTKHEFKSSSIEPGPGSYTPVQVSTAAPSWKFGSSKKRLELNDHSVPEPSWYHSRLNSKK